MSKAASTASKKSICDVCHLAPATRLSLFSAICDHCFLTSELRYNANDERLGYRIENELFPYKHRGVEACTACKGQNLVILYDEVDDEWLYCAGCKNFKQLLRCWNMYTNTMIDFLEKPIIKTSEFYSGGMDAIGNDSDESESKDDTADDTASEASSILEPELIDPADVEYDSAGDMIYEEDLPPLEKIIVQEEKVAASTSTNKKKQKNEGPPVSDGKQQALKSNTAGAKEGVPDPVSASDSDSDGEVKKKTATKRKITKNVKKRK